MNKNIKNEFLFGFGNEFASEVVPGAIPHNRFSPQRHKYYVEKFSTTAFTAPRCQNRRNWFYRIRPSVAFNRYSKVDINSDWLSAGVGTAVDSVKNFTPNPLRWGAISEPSSDACFVKGIKTILTFGDVMTQTGGAVSYFFWGKSDSNHFHYNADAEVMMMPVNGTLGIMTECGYFELTNSEVAVIPRGMKWRPHLDDKGASGYLCENYGAPFELPERGPIGSDGLANTRDFISPIAEFEQNVGPSSLIAKVAGNFYEVALNDSPLDVVGWVGNSVPYKYDLRKFNTINTVSYDHPDPSIFTVLTSQSDTSGVANIDFGVFPPRWMVAEDTFRPPWFHRNCMSECMGLLSGSYDAKPDGFVPGGMSVHNSFTPHGPDTNAYDKANAGELEPVKLTDSMAFMLESRYVLVPTKYAMQHPALQKDYQSCWDGFAK